MTNAHFLSSVPGPGQVLPGGDLDVCVVALYQLHRTARQLEQAAVVGDKAGFFGIQLFQRSKVLCAVKALRGLHRIQGAAVGRCVHKAGIRHNLSVAARCSLDGILYRYGRCSCAAPGRCFQRCCDDGLTDEGSCRVVHCHKLPCCRQHAVFALSARVVPPVTICTGFVQSAACCSTKARFLPATSTISVTSGSCSNARMLRCSTVSPPRSKLSLSKPMRVEDPAATSTADTLFSNFFTCPIPIVSHILL